MKAHHKLFKAKRFVLAKCPLIIFPLVFLCIFGFTELECDRNPSPLIDQHNEPDLIHVQVFDFRGQGDSVALKSARGNSKDNVLILLVLSTSKEHIDAVKRIATGHVRLGRKRIAVFLGDKSEGWKSNGTLFFVNGKFTRVVLQKQGSVTTKGTLIDAIKEEYDSNIH